MSSLGRYFLISEEEAKATWGADYKSYWSYSRGGYVAGYVHICLLSLTSPVQLT
jgi:hypothetical protein